jgi:uncharacterized protein YdaU (DUF1376 family)
MARTQVDHYIPFFGRDFYASTAMWTAEEVGHYIRLLVIQWDSGGLPSDLERLELVSPGVGRVWQLLSSKFPACDDGLRRNARMEEHRARAEDLKEARSEAGQEGNRKRWGDRKPVANGSQKDRKAIANGIAKVSPPSPSPSPSLSSSPKDECRTHTPPEGDEFRQKGWAADEWQRFVADWNATGNAVPWTPLVPPASWVDLAATPGWLDRAHQAMHRLPACQFFDKPLAVTRFFEYLDRILAGEFDNAKHDARKRREPVGGNL